MKFIKTPDVEVGVKEVITKLRDELAKNQRVLLLICGGSNIPHEVRVLRAVQKHKHAKNLAVLFMDERFGPVGHAYSNWQQLLDAGADLSGLYALPVLRGLRLDETVNQYTKLSNVAFGAADVILGLFGLGADGHTAGILPRSVASRKSAPAIVAYKSPPYTRITMTYKVLSRVTVAYVFSFGKTKADAVKSLKLNEKSFNSMPSKLFYDLPEAYVYNDTAGGIL